MGNVWWADGFSRTLRLCLLPGLDINPLRAKFFSRTINMFLQFCHSSMLTWHRYSRVSNNSVDTLIKTALDFPWWLAYLIPPRLLKFSKFSILYIPTDVILRCLTRYRVTRSFIRLTVRPFFGGFSRSRLHSGVQYKSFIASIWFMPPNTMKLHW